MPAPVPVTHEEPLAPPAPKEAVPRAPSPDEARNLPSVALYVADRLDFVDKIVTLRVTAELGDYFGCYYKGRKGSYRHLRLRGDSSMYLDGYLPRDSGGEGLWARLKKKKTLRLTVRVVMRPGTLQGVCVGQVEILDHRKGWDFDAGGVGEPGALENRIRNARDRERARNRPSIAAWGQSRAHFRGRTTTFRVRGRLDRLHQCRYRDAERTHYALQLQGDAFDGLRGYVRRDSRGRELAEYLAWDEGARIRVQVTVPDGRDDETCPDQVEVIGWEKGWEAPQR